MATQEISLLTSKAWLSADKQLERKVGASQGNDCISFLCFTLVFFNTPLDFDYTLKRETWV